MVRRMGRHRHNLVLLPLGSLPCLTLAGTVQLFPASVSSTLCVCVKFLTILTVLPVQCVTLLLLWWLLLCSLRGWMPWGIHPGPTQCADMELAQKRGQCNVHLGKESEHWLVGSLSSRPLLTCSSSVLFSSLRDSGHSRTAIVEQSEIYSLSVFHFPYPDEHVLTVLSHWWNSEVQIIYEREYINKRGKDFHSLIKYNLFSMWGTGLCAFFWD